MAKGEENGTAIAAHSTQVPGMAIAKLAKKKFSSCSMVTGIDRVWTSRTVEASEPIARKIEPSSR